MTTIWRIALLAGTFAAGGCAVTPQYTVRPPPQPVESPGALEIEREISRIQAAELEKPGATPVRPGQILWGFDLDGTLQKLARVSERPNLYYRVVVVKDKDPNAAALADGRVYFTTGMLNYLAGRGSKPDELAFIMGHELAHTVAQHLVKRYEQMQKEQLLMAVVGAGTSALSPGIGTIAQTAAGLLANVAASGYSQAQELEADQLGARYCKAAGYDPWAGIEMLTDFQRFDHPGAFMSTHPPTPRRIEDLQRYLTETSGASVPAAATNPAPTTMRTPTPPLSSRGGSTDEKRQRLLQAQKLYPAGSQSWKNLQKQIEDLDR